MAEEAVIAAAVAAMAAMETPPLQEGPPQGTPGEETTDSLDNPQTYSLGTARRRKSSSHNGNSTTI